MAEGSDRMELLRRLEQARRMAGSALDPLSKERLTRLVQELDEQLRLSEQLETPNKESCLKHEL